MATPLQQSPRRSASMEPLPSTDNNVGPSSPEGARRNSASPVLEDTISVHSSRSANPLPEEQPGRGRLARWRASLSGMFTQATNFVTRRGGGSSTDQAQAAEPPAPTQPEAAATAADGVNTSQAVNAGGVDADGSKRDLAQGGPHSDAGEAGSAQDKPATILMGTPPTQTAITWDTAEDVKNRARATKDVGAATDDMEQPPIDDARSDDGVVGEGAGAVGGGSASEQAVEAEDSAGPSAVHEEDEMSPAARAATTAVMKRISKNSELQAAFDNRGLDARSELIRTAVEYILDRSHEDAPVYGGTCHKRLWGAAKNAALQRRAAQIVFRALRQ